MTNVKLTQTELNEIYSEGEVEVNGVKYTEIEIGEWTQEGKYQSASVIFTDGEKTYRGYVSRSGSPFTDWHWDDYGDADITEVEKREITITKWVRV